MKLLNGHILIKVDDPVSKTKSGLLLQEGAQRLPQTGTVEAVSDDVMTVKPGDRVVFLRYATIDWTDKEHRLCKQEHVVGVINDTAA